MLDEAKLVNALDRLGSLTLAVAGDLFLDEYLHLDAGLTEESVETGLDAYQVAEVRTSPGAGGTVLNNLAALGVGRLLAVSVIGCDAAGFELKRELRKRGIALDLLVESPDRFTPTYIKPMLDEGAGPPRELNRLDVKNRTPSPVELESTVIAHLDDAFRQADALIIADQVEQSDCGVITATVRKHLADLAAGHPEKLVLADSRARIGLYRNVSLKPNLTECVRAATPLLTQAQPPAAGEANVDAARRAAEALARRAGRAVYCTLGSDGILYCDAARSEHVPGYSVAGPIDIVGAGDAATSGVVSGLCAGLAPTEAAALGNLVASITIRQLGTTGTATPEQVLERWAEINASA